MRMQILCHVALLVAISAAQAQTSDQSVATFHTSTRIVAVAIAATRSDGSPVEDLRPSDVRVFDNGKPQTIASFEAMEPPRPEGRAGTFQHTQMSVAAGYPHFSIILLDALNTSWSDQIYARRAVEHLLDYIPAEQRIAIFALGDRLYLLHDFSSNATELRAALHRFSMGQPHGGVPSSTPGPFSAESSHPNTPSFSSLTRLVEGGSSSEVLFYQRNRILQTLETLTAIAGLARHIPGQKDLLWVSSAFPLRLPGMHGELYGDSFYDQMEQTTQALSSAGLRLYPVDARGLSVEPNTLVNIDTMRQMAEETGGRAFYNNNDLSSEMRQALEDSRKGYLLTYTPNDFREDGSFHRIRVRVLRHGVKLRYRPGYSAELPSATAGRDAKR
jgi:VWFA-related protein